MLFEAPELDELEIGVLARIEDLKGVLALRLHEPRRWIGSIRRQMFARTIQGSNTIEGYTATVDDVGAIVAREEPFNVKDETRLALEGYRDAMTYIMQVAQDPGLECSTQLIKGLHFMMTGYDLEKSPDDGVPVSCTCAMTKPETSSTKGHQPRRCPR